MDQNTLNTKNGKPDLNIFYSEMYTTVNILTYKGKLYKVDHQTITDQKTGESCQLDELRDLGLIYLLKKVLLGYGE